MTEPERVFVIRASGLIRHSGFELRASPHYIPHDPGAPPHRPHVGSDGADDFPPDSDPTANTLSARAVFGEPQVGHFGLTSFVIERCNCSNRPPQPWHVYS